MSNNERKVEFYPMAGGIHIALPDSLELITPYVVREQYDWFEDEMPFVRRVVTPGACAIDVGAAFGVYTLTMARLAGPTGLVVAAEPGNAAMLCLRVSAERLQSPCLRLCQVAIADREGSTYLYEASSPELNRLSSKIPENLAVEKKADYKKVDVITLDQLFDEQCGGRSVDFLKLDAEGAEGLIIDGGNAFLREQSPLVMYEIKHGATINLDVMKELEQFGYRSYELVPGLNALSPANFERLDDYRINLLCCKDDRAEMLAHRGLLWNSFASPKEKRQADPYLWTMFLDKFPYAQPFVHNRYYHSGVGKPYLNGIAAYSRAMICCESLAIRDAALREAFALLNQAATEKPSLPRLLSLARVAAAVGQRSRAVEALQSVFMIYVNHADFSIDEPFLMPDARYDTTLVGDQLAAFSVLAALETLERLRAFSSFYTGVSLLDSLKLMRLLDSHGSPHSWSLSNDILRRERLIKERFGLAQEK